MKGHAMHLLKFAGVRLPKPGDDTVADQAIRSALAAVADAHGRLRRLIASDPHAAGIICRALGCQHPDCQDPLPVIEARSGQIPPVIEKLSDQPQNPVLPKPHDLRDG